MKAQELLSKLKYLVSEKKIIFTPDTRITFVLTGNYHQFRNYLLATRSDPRKTRYLCSEEQLRGLRSCDYRIVRTGAFYRQSPNLRIAVEDICKEWESRGLPVQESYYSL